MGTILMLHRGGSSIRGSEQCLIENAAALKASGFRVVLLRNDMSVDAAIERFVERIVPFEFPELMVTGLRARLPVGHFARQFLALRQLVKDENPSLIWANGGLPCQLAVPVSSLAKVPLICHFHHPASRRYLKWWLVDRVPHLLFPSVFTASVCRERIGKSGEVIYNGVDVDRFRPAQVRNWDWRRRLGLPDDAIVFGQVSALQQHKRHKLLVQAFAAAIHEMPNIYLVLVGSGPEKQAIESCAAELGILDRVQLVGYVPDTLPFYQHVFDVNVLASAEEGLGISALEGAACGLPCIATNGTGLKEAVTDGVTAITFQVDDMRALAASIVHLASSSEHRRRLGQAGRAFVVEKFDRRQYASRIVALAKETISRAGSQ